MQSIICSNINREFGYNIPNGSFSLSLLNGEQYGLFGLSITVFYLFLTSKPINEFPNQYFCNVMSVHFRFVDLKVKGVNCRRIYQSN